MFIVPTLKKIALRRSATGVTREAINILLQRSNLVVVNFVYSVVLLLFTNRRL